MCDGIKKVRTLLDTADDFLRNHESQYGDEDGWIVDALDVVVRAQGILKKLDQGDLGVVPSLKCRMCARAYVDRQSCPHCVEITEQIQGVSNKEVKF